MVSLTSPAHLVRFLGHKPQGCGGKGREGTGRDGTGRDGTGRDGTGRDGTGRDGTGRDGTGRDGTGRGVWERQRDGVSVADRCCLVDKLPSCYGGKYSCWWSVVLA